MHLDLSRRELRLKLVYFGPGLSGKTTNLQSLHSLLSHPGVGRLLTLKTLDDRTLFMDLLPVVFHSPTAFQVKMRLVTVPGQIMHAATRRVLLEEADGIVFVAHSEISETAANIASFHDLRSSLSVSTPMVIQFNKRDLPNIRTEAELQRFAEGRGAPVHTAIAVQGLGVLDTLDTALRLTWRSLASENLEHHLGVDEATFVARILGQSGPTL